MELIQQADISILLWIQENLRSDFLTGILKAVTTLGNAGWFWIALGLAFLCVKKLRPVGIAMLVSLAIGALITNVALKNLVARIRPYDTYAELIPLLGPQADYSFPSGHTCASFAAAVVCFRLLPRRYGIPALVLAALIAFSRLYLGVHYPTDVLGGLLVGVISAFLACSLLNIWKKRRSGEHRRL